MLAAWHGKENPAGIRTAHQYFRFVPPLIPSSHDWRRSHYQFRHQDVANNVNPRASIATKFLA